MFKSRLVSCVNNKLTLLACICVFATICPWFCFDLVCKLELLAFGLFFRENKELKLYMTPFFFPQPSKMRTPQKRTSLSTPVLALVTNKKP